MDRALRVLHLEDDAGDAGLVRDVLELGGIDCDITRVQTREDFVASLEKGGLDLILADYSLPSFDGMSALKIAAQQSPDVPFIFVSGMLGEELAIEALKLGATDYVLKERLSRIVSAVRGALREAQYRADRKQAEQALRASEERFRTLVQFSFDVYWETDAQHRFIRQDFAVALPTGPEIGKTRWEVPYLEPDEEAWRKHRATLDAHLPFRDLELARPTPDGGERYFSISGLPVFDETGRFIGYRGVSHDITERKLAEEERRAHLRFLESMDRVNRAMQGANDLERMMSDVLDAVLEVFDCDRAWLIYPCDPEAASWRAVMEHTQPQFPGAFALGTDLPIDAETAAVFRAARASSGALPFGPGYDLQLPVPVAERFSIRSQIAMAVYPKVDQAYLFGLHQCSRQRVWTAQEKRLFEEIGRRLADALTSLLVFRTLSESERKLEAAQRIAHVGYWERDFVKGSVALSDETRQLFGGATDLRQFDERALERVHPEDRSKFAEAFTAALRGGPPYDLEYRVVRPDGALRIVHSQGGYVTRDESGRPVRMFGAIQDITELRRAEEELRASEARFRRLTGLSADWYWKQDENLRFTYFSNEAYEKEGYPTALSLGKTRWELPLTPLKGGWDEHRAVLAARQPFRDFEFSRIDQSSGGMLYTRVSGVPVFDERGAFMGYEGVASDITQRKLAEETLREAQDALARVNRVATLGVLAASIAHEVNQPLGAMVTSAASCARWLAARPPDFDKAKR
ncbi:MAG TPA: PAS domain S-box protein, partial [Casimicrobiaceae bacterium]|nr:PAS domain S-box protein [Casimicrobiaceae bacterium]